MKLPIFKAIGMTFAFVFGHFGDVVKIVWLPLAVMMAAIYWIDLKIIPLSTEMVDLGAHADPETALEALVPMFEWLALMLLALAIFMPMIFSGLLRFVIRGERPDSIIYLRFAGDELRLLITWILKGLLICAIYVGGAIALGLVIALLAVVSKPLSMLGAAIGSIALLIFMLWVFLRLSLTLPAAIGARKIGIGPSWSSTKGAVWSLLLYWFLWCVMLVILEIALGMLIMPEYFQNIAELSATISGHYQDPEMVRDAVRQFNVHLMGIVQGRLVVLCAVGFVLSLVVYPLMIVSGGVAYRLISEGASEGSQSEA